MHTTYHFIELYDLTPTQRYLMIKAMTPEERKKVVKKVVFFAGKAAPGYYIAKLVRHLVVSIVYWLLTLPRPFVSSSILHA